MNAADYYGLDELKRACSGFVQCCVTVDTVCALLATAERYIQYKCTKYIVQKVLEFVDDHGNEVLNLGSFALLPQHVVRLILARDELQADEFVKFQVCLKILKFSTKLKQFCISGCHDVEQEILRCALWTKFTGRFERFFGLHQLSHDSSKRFDERNSPIG